MRPRHLAPWRTTAPIVLARGGDNRTDQEEGAYPEESAEQHFTSDDGA